MSFSAAAVVEAARGRLATVEDPQLGLDIISLGPVHAVEHADAGLRIVYTLTSMGCPLETELVFDPPWSPEKTSDDAKLLLGVYG